MTLNKKILTGIVAMGAFGVVGFQNANADTVTVKQGDTLSDIALKHNTTVDNIVKKNNLKNKNLILVGQTLETDSTMQTTQQVDVNANEVTVKSGDTLGELAATYGTTVDNIKNLNGLTSDFIYVGQVLYLKGSVQVQQQSQSQTQQVPSNNQAYAPTTSSYQTPTSTPNNNVSISSSTSNGGEESAKAWIASRESGGNYNAQNGQYIGKYQLSSSYLGGDYSPANQERVADNYVKARYGSWQGAQSFWQSHGWY